MDTSRLRFTPPEAEAFLREAVAGEISPAVMADLQERADGWAAGLRLAALALQNRDPAETGPLIQSFSGTHRYVADYLIQEVFQNQPPAVQDFLLKTCFLDRLTGSLCDAVTGAVDGTAVLERLVRENLFTMPLEQSRERTWFRYHPLFAESIQTIARPRLGEAGVASIYAKASGWYETHGLYEEAVQAALSAKLYPRALELIGKFIQIHELSSMRTLASWLEGVPEHAIVRHPEIAFAYAQVILYTSPDRFAPATAARLEPYASAAEKTWGEQSNRPRLGRLLSFRGIVSWWQGDFPKAFRYARQSLDDLPEEDVFWRGNSLLIASQEALSAGRIMEAQGTVLEARALLGAAQNKYGVLAAIQMLGEGLYGQGELDQAEQLSQQILAEAVGEESMLDDQGIASLALANIAYERNDLAQAGQLASRALDLARARGNDLLEVHAVIRQAYIHAARHEAAQAHDLLTSLIARIQNPAYVRDAQEAQARLAIWMGDLQTPLAWQALIAEDKAPRLIVQEEREAFTLARLRIAQGKSEAALGILEGRVAEAAENGRVRSQVTALLLEALALHAQDNQYEAAKPLVEALRISQAKGFRRLILDEGRAMGALLQAVSPMLPNRVLRLYTTALLHSFEPETVPRPTTAALVEPLSRQELRVLRLLAAGLSNTDIARELVVSTNTVKTQVKSIYRKLDVSSRDEARELARELNLV